MTSPKQLIPLFFGIAILLAVGCSSGSTPDASPQPGAGIKVVTTIYPTTYFAQRIGGDRVSINSLIRPGVEAHDFEPTPGDIIDLRNADVLLYTNPAFEVWVQDALDSLGSDLVTVATADMSGTVDGIDPHVWLNPIEAIDQVRAIQSAFSTADPGGADIYAANADTLIAELRTLDAEFTDALASCTKDIIVVSHEAYGHLARQYGINQIGLADLSAEFESTPRRVAEIVQQMNALDIRYILQEPIVSDHLATTVAAETGAQILPLHPLESLTSEQANAGDTYFSVMRRNLVSLKTALGCG